MFLFCVGIIGKIVLFGKVIENDEDFVIEFLEIEGVVVVYGLVFGFGLNFWIFYVMVIEVFEEVCICI